MPITVNWDDSEQNVLHFVYMGQWTWDDYQRVTLQARELAKIATGQIDVIANFSQSSPLPNNALSYFRKSYTTAQSTIGFNIAVLVFRDSFLTRMIEVFQRLYASGGGKITTTSSVEAARQIIRDRRLAKNQ